MKTIEDRQLLVQSSDNANYVDIYYQDDAGNFADETVNLATIAFKRSDSFEISERTCDAVEELHKQALFYFDIYFPKKMNCKNGTFKSPLDLNK